MPAYDEGSGYFSIEGDELAAYDLDPGTRRWVVSIRPQSAPLVGGSLLFVEQADSLAALRTTDGSVSWQLPLSSRLTAPLVWRDGSLLTVSNSAVTAFRALDGEQLWQQDVAAAVRAEPAFAGDRVYVPIEDGRVVALAASDGTIVWQRRLGSAAHAIHVANGRLFVGSSDNHLYCLNARDGQIEWRWQTGADVVSMPLADDRRVYFVSLDNMIRALNQRNGVQQWKRALQFRPAWGPVKAGDTLILAGVDGPVRAFMLKDGAPAGDLMLDSGAELAAPPYVFDSPSRLGPTVVSVTRRLASGATVIASSRSVEPTVLPSLAPLPGLVPVTIPIER